eukprot:gene35703-48000_t
MDDYDIVLLEKYPCNSKDELHARERKNMINNITKLTKCKYSNATSNSMNVNVGVQYKEYLTKQKPETYSMAEHTEPS